MSLTCLLCLYVYVFPNLRKHALLDGKVIFLKFQQVSFFTTLLLLRSERADTHRFTTGTTRLQPIPPSKELFCLPESADFHIHVFKAPAPTTLTVSQAQSKAKALISLT